MAPSERGVTLLESVLAVVILGMVATAVMTATAFVLTAEARSRKLLGAYELANRLVLQYLDDDTKMPERALPLDYADHSYAWDYRLDQVGMELSTTGQARVPASALGYLSRFQAITVTVYEGEDGLAGGVVRGEPIATIVRIFDPTGVRNADAMDRLGKDSVRVQRLLGTVTGGALGTTGEQSSGSGGSSTTRERRERRRSK